MDGLSSKSSTERGASSRKDEAPRLHSARLRRWRKPLFAASVALGAFLLWQFVTAEEPLPERAANTPLGIEVRDLKSLLVRRDGKRLWELKAARIKVAADGSQTVAEQMDRGVLYQDEKPYLIVKAPKVTLKNATNDVTVSGGLHLSGPRDLTMTTARAEWSHRTQLLTCPKPVQAHLKSLKFSFPKLVLSTKSGTLSSDGTSRSDW